MLQSSCTAKSCLRLQRKKWYDEQPPSTLIHVYFDNSTIFKKNYTKNWNLNLLQVFWFLALLLLKEDAVPGG
jgi:hypothetical protein